MVHPNTDLLTAYWRARQPAFGCPPRAAVDPGDFLALLPQVFILGRTGPGRYPFRLVGGLVADLHGRDLRDEDAMSLWRSQDQAPVAAAMERAARRVQPVVVQAEAGPLPLEILLLPLADSTGAPTRFLGHYQPLSSMIALLDRPPPLLGVRRIGLPSDADLPAGAPRLRLAAVDGRRIA